MQSPIEVTFWGVRGSVPAPLTAKEVREKKRSAIQRYLDLLKQAPQLTIEHFIEAEEYIAPSTYGGNTSCVEVRYGEIIIVLDMGTGLRPLGNSLFPQMFQQRGLEVTFLLSHVHWDHVQGIPFFGPLYEKTLAREGKRFIFYGGTDWQQTAETILKGQMDPPKFPISWPEMEKFSRIEYGDLHDTKELLLGPINIVCMKLNHPQETYGFRMTFPNEKVIVYSTDNEPYDPCHPDPQLLRLSQHADLWITDCQYTKGVYEGLPGSGGVPRHGWGHSYPEAVAQTAFQNGAKNVILFHHDPASPDALIKEIERFTQQLIYDKDGRSKVIAAHEGLKLTL